MLSKNNKKKQEFINWIIHYFSIYTNLEEYEKNWKYYSCFICFIDTYNPATDQFDADFSDATLYNDNPIKEIVGVKTRGVIHFNNVPIAPEPKFNYQIYIYIFRPKKNKKNSES